MSIAVPQGVHSIEVAYIGSKAVPKAVAPTSEPGPALPLLPRYIGIQPFWPAPPTEQAFLYPSPQEWDLIPVDTAIDNGKRYIKNKYEDKYLYPSPVLEGYIMAGDNRFVWDIIHSFDLLTFKISVNLGGKECAIGVEKPRIDPPGDDAVLPPVYLPALVLQTQADAATWIFQEPRTPK
ncbi:hypothetical protein BDN72DRAFT_849353 [Pluteus cervinus]|uniref:Uncharacterized protein n=1 Tax=Pluteus cervinus TaxID=181527 RepID=A0ACD3A882_9AGAR|nr:hypothetical protein BDN72DRAFT_849353 [Pluteus cervinus]